MRELMLEGRNHVEYSMWEEFEDLRIWKMHEKMDGQTEYAHTARKGET